MTLKSSARHLLIVAVFAAALMTVPTATAGQRIVAVGDIHGAYDSLVAILQRAGLVDESVRWIGGDAIFVQTGDMLDRGVEVRRVLDLLMRLQKEAAAAGGEVIVLLGNHEGMNLIGFYRDVNPEVYATFVDADSEKRRKAAFKDFKRYWRARAEALGAAPPDFTPDIEDQWMETFPPGWLEYNDALGPDGVYGAWLRERPVAVVIGDVLFIHGGIGPDIAGMSVEEINAKVAEELATYDRLRRVMIDRQLVPTTAGLNSLINAYNGQDPPDPELATLGEATNWLIRSAGGPLWFRGAARWEEEVDSERMVELLTEVGAQRMVGGHTVQDQGRIEVRFGGRVFLIDTGMLSSVYTGGRPSALVIQDGVFSALYTDGTSEVLVDQSLPAAA